MTLKHLLVSALALIATPSIFAQATGAPARGYRGFVDVNILPGSLKESDSNLTYDYNRVGILTTHGFQLNQRIFVGLGLGFEEYTDDSLIEDFNTIIPIYAAFRCDFVPRNVTPFAEARLGGFAGDYSGVLFNFGAGVRVWRFNLSLGYEMLQGDVDIESDYGTIESCNLVSNNFVLRLGVDIGRRQ